RRRRPVTQELFRGRRCLSPFRAFASLALSRSQSPGPLARRIVAILLRRAIQRVGDFADGAGDHLAVAGGHPLVEGDGDSAGELAHAEAAARERLHVADAVGEISAEPAPEGRSGVVAQRRARIEAIAARDHDAALARRDRLGDLHAEAAHVADRAEATALVRT